jgi:putative ABC transport system permease protein
VVIVSRRMAETLWPGREAVGQKLLSGEETADNAWARVVGVVGDTRWNAAEAPGFEMYASHRQWPIPASHLLVRVAGDPRAIVPLARRVVHEVEPDLAINDVKTMEQVVSESLWQRRLWGALFSAFGVIAVAMAALGLYGVLSHAVGQRRRELGVRMALGARGRDLVVLLVREGMTLAIAGAALGLWGALALARLVRSLVFGVSPTDPATLAAAFVLLALTALGACLVPALRAARLDPATCLCVD